MKQVDQDGHPILLVVHDAKDGGWEFLTGGAFDVAGGMIVSLGSMVQRDPSLAELADLPPGWQAWRSAPGAPWQRCFCDSADVA